VSLELTGADGSRPSIEAAQPEHPSLLDPTHQMDALFGVVNIPNVIWIDEEGTIVRPPEPGWPGTRGALPDDLLSSMPPMGRAPHAPPPPENADLLGALGSGQDRSRYADAIRDWAEHGPESPYALTPSEVVEHSQPRPVTTSEAVAHFELANHLWHEGQRERAVVHFRECHRLQPDNWTYKRQAWSLFGNERVGGTYGRFVQSPLEGEEDEWPFESDFRSDVEQLRPGQYYPKTL
jgi:hypothetical protein